MDSTVPSTHLGWLCLCQAVDHNQMSMAVRAMRTAVVSDVVSLVEFWLNLVTHRNQSECRYRYDSYECGELGGSSFFFTSPRWTCQERTSGGLWLVGCGRVLRKKTGSWWRPPIRGMPEARRKMSSTDRALWFSPARFFSRRRLVNSKPVRKEEQRNRKTVFFEVVLPSLAKRHRYHKESESPRATRSIAS